MKVGDVAVGDVALGAMTLGAVTLGAVTLGSGALVFCATGVCPKTDSTIEGGASGAVGSSGGRRTVRFCDVTGTAFEKAPGIVVASETLKDGAEAASEAIGDDVETDDAETVGGIAVAASGAPKELKFGAISRLEKEG